MATFTETSVRVVVELVRDGAEQILYLTGHSRAEDGTILRHHDKVDVTAALTPDQVQAGLLLLDAAEAYLKAVYNIPETP